MTLQTFCTETSDFLKQYFLKAFNSVLAMIQPHSERNLLVHFLMDIEIAFMLQMFYFCFVMKKMKFKVTVHITSSVYG